MVWKYWVRLFALVFVVSYFSVDALGVKFKLSSRSMGNRHVAQRSQVRNRTRMTFHPHVVSLLNWEKRSDFLVRNPVALKMNNGIISVTRPDENPLEHVIDPALSAVGGSWEQLESRVISGLDLEGKGKWELSEFNGIEKDTVSGLIAGDLGREHVTYDLLCDRLACFRVYINDPNIDILDIADGMAVGYCLGSDYVQKPCFWRHDGRHAWNIKRVDVPALARLKRPGDMMATIARTGHSDSGLVVGSCLLEGGVSIGKKDLDLRSHGFYYYPNGDSGVLPSGGVDLVLTYCISENGRVIGGSINDGPAVWFYKKRSLIEGESPWELCVLGEDLGQVNYICPKGRVAVGHAKDEACVWVLGEQGYQRVSVYDILLDQGFELDGSCRLEEVVWVSSDYRQFLINGRITRDKSGVAFLISLEEPCVVSLGG